MAVEPGCKLVRLAVKTSVSEYASFRTILSLPTALKLALKLHDTLH